jgi:hypothetical protein
MFLFPDLTNISGKATNKVISNPVDIIRISIYKEPGISNSSYYYRDRDKGLYNYINKIYINLN